MNVSIGINSIIWIGIIFCISQSAMFSGLNLAFFSVTRLRLEVEVEAGNRNARKVLEMRKDSNFLLTTILWGNVGINVLLTLLSNSVMAGVTAFLFSTVLITFIGEIIPQAYFSRNALKMASLLAPVLRFYQIVFFPIAKPVAWVLDMWLGREGIRFYREKDLKEVLRKHVASDDADVGHLEGMGALNFLNIDDLPVTAEGEPVDPQSVVKMSIEGRLPVFPHFERSPADPFLKKIEASGKKWVILTDDSGNPRLVMDSDGFLRDALFDHAPFNPLTHCHLPVIVEDPRTKLGDVILSLKAPSECLETDVIDRDIILLWGEEKRVITGADILGHLLKNAVACLEDQGMGAFGDRV